jgi:hypothetical protein
MFTILSIGFLISVGLLTVIGLVYVLGLFVYLAVMEPVAAAKIISLVLIALCLAFFPWGMRKVTKKFAKAHKTDVENKQPSLLAAKYHSWKHKYCPAIEYENDNN